jgi:hypothetical protein
VTTAADIELRRVRDILNMGIESVLSQVYKAINCQELPPGIELYIDLAPGVVKKRPVVRYYIVHYFDQKVVWLSNPSSQNVQMISESLLTSWAILYFLMTMIIKIVNFGLIYKVFLLTSELI